MPKRRVRDRIGQLMRKRGWHYRTPSNGLRHRVYSLMMERHPWYDWGHRLVILVGDCQSGNWSEPTPPTWWYRQGEPKRMWRTGYPRHPLSTYEVITDYETFRTRTEGLNEDQLYEWQAINANQDGDLHLGHRYWGGTFYDLRRDDVALLRRYLRRWHRQDWFGLRSWLYKQGLHACVYVRKPGACNATPPHGQGGYSHWLCQLKRKHEGTHRYHNYVWTEIDGEQIGVMHRPTESADAS